MNRRLKSARRDAAKAAGFRSAFEAEMAGFLSGRKIPFTFEEGAVKYTSPVKGGLCLACNSGKTGKRRVYIPDFRVGAIILETKGKLDSPGRTKLIAIKASNPTLDLRLVFQADNKIRRNSATHYSDWARDHGFPYHVGTKLPAKWVRELKAAAKKAKGDPGWGVLPEPRKKEPTNGDYPT